MIRISRAVAVALVMGSLGQAVEAGAPAPLQVHEAPRALPELAITDRNGDPVTLTEFRGKTVLLNLWATWCVPCREEMPALDRLQARLGGDAFQVVALSIDRGGAEVVQRFYAEIGIRNLEIFTDPTGKVARDLAIPGLPVTLLVDGEGRETARAIGPVAWDEPEILEFIRTQLKPNATRTIRFQVPVVRPAAHLDQSTSN